MQQSGSENPEEAVRQEHERWLKTVLSYKDQRDRYRAEVERLRGALEWYADPDNYSFGVVAETTVGQRARDALDAHTGGGE